MTICCYSNEARICCCRRPSDITKTDAQCKLEGMRRLRKGRCHQKREKEVCDHSLVPSNVHSKSGCKPKISNSARNM